MLVAKDIQKAYGELPILKGVNLEVGKGEIVSIVGSSGAGKTTLLQILGTLDKPDSGILEIGGVNPFKLSQKELSNFRNTSLGFIFQFHQLLPEFTAIENAMLPALIGGKSKKEAEQLALPLLERLGIESRKTHKPSELSGGEQQRVAVCRALINNPKVIFADEPSGNLDTKNAKELHELFFQLRDEFNQTFVIVTHNEELAQMADRSLVMRDGKFL
ncbi:MAG: ABC transporter ATP-binding protein [Flavobacteriales bacterium]|nr:ABC transporter ATP-binding protein [Crocinitomicaceae bacterium]NBX79460.1 ABC transporter ATP-binding protein [Flavobacteriales bacterium]